MLARRMLIVLTAMGAVLLIHAGAASALPSEKIFFTNEDEFCAGCTVSTMNPDGSGKTNLTKTPEADEDDPTWSPDGTKMAYTRSYDDSSGKRVFDIWTMNADGSGQTRLAAGAGGAGDLGTQNSAPDWSPTDDRIAFERIEVTVREGTDYDIWTINADGSGPRDLTDDASPTGDSQASPDWSPDGSKIAFTSFAYYQSGPNCLGSGIYTMNSDGSGQARITNKVSQACDASEWRDDGDSQWSPGGGKIAFYSRPDIWTVNADGSGQTRVTNTPNTWEALFDWGLYDPPDTTKPSVSAPRPKPGSVTRDRTPTISATVKDNLTNLSRDNITLRVAGKRVSTFAYDCATDKLTYTPKRLTKGKKTVSIAATDAALNVGTKS